MPVDQPGDEVHLTRMLGRFWTIANVLSLLRLILVLPITYLIWTDGSLLWIFGLILFGGATDWFDGRIARWSNTVSEWGKVLDPLADKVAASFITMALVGRGSLPLWFLAVIVARDTAIVLGGGLLARRTQQVVMSLWAGKLAVTALAFTVLAALLHADPPILRLCLWTTTALMGYSFLRYAFRFAQLVRAGEPEAPETPQSPEEPGASPEPPPAPHPERESAE